MTEAAGNTRLNIPKYEVVQFSDYIKEMFVTKTK